MTAQPFISDLRTHATKEAFHHVDSIRAMPHERAVERLAELIQEAWTKGYYKACGQVQNYTIQMRLDAISDLNGGEGVNIIRGEKS